MNLCAETMFVFFAFFNFISALFFVFSSTFSFFFHCVFYNFFFHFYFNFSLSFSFPFSFPPSFFILSLLYRFLKIFFLLHLIVILWLSFFLKEFQQSETENVNLWVNFFSLIFPLTSLYFLLSFGSLMWNILYYFKHVDVSWFKQIIFDKLF